MPGKSKGARDEGSLHPFVEGERWASGFERLFQGVQGADPVGDRSGGLPCEEVQSLLDLYVADEEAGEEVQRLYPALWNHLRDCDACQELYALISARPPLLLGARPATPARWLDAWQSEPLRGPSGQIGVTFRFLLTYLQGLFAPGLLVARSMPSPAPYKIVLHERVTLDGAPLFVELRALAGAPAGQLSLELVVVEEGALPDPLIAQLTWGESRVSAVVDEAGRARFDGLPIALLEEENGSVELTLSMAGG